MLSEEEIIKKVDDFIDGYRQYDVKTGETIIPYKYGEGQRFCYKEEYEAIQGLLDLYKKEKEKNDTLQTNYEILQGEMDRIGIDILGLEPGNSTDDVIDKIKALLKENRKLRNCHLRYEEMTGIDLLMEE